MNNLTLSTKHDTNATLISNIFIDKYMPDANGEFVKIYIYLLRVVANSSSDVSVSSMADIFNQTEADVIRALKYWDKNGVLQLSFDNEQQPCGITLCNLALDDNASVTTYEEADTTSTTQDVDVKESDSKDSTDDKANDNKANDNKANNNNFKVISYTPSQIMNLSSRDVDFKMLLHGIGNYLGATLSPNEISTVAFMYDTLHFPSDLIEYLIEYCAKRGHKSMRYIEKVALSWANDGIKTLKQAKNETSTRNETVFTIMNAFGLSERHPGQEENNYIEKWIKEYGFSTEVIVEACNRTLRATHQPSFQYADSILTKWFKNNIYTYSDIMKADIKFELSRSSNKKKTVVKNAVNRFNNFSQRDTDIDNLESSLLSTNI